jgi:hypothetical protein
MVEPFEDSKITGKDLTYPRTLDSNCSKILIFLSPEN